MNDPCEVGDALEMAEQTQVWTIAGPRSRIVANRPKPSFRQSSCWGLSLSLQTA